MADQSINLPQILAVALVGFFALRWFMSKSSSSPSEPSQRSSSSRQRNQVDPSKVEQIATMFPGMDRRQIAWDLHRNGGSVEATCNRVLTGAGLETPPPSFQPQLAPDAGLSDAALAGVALMRKSELSRPDLITRYNLESRVGGKGKEPVLSEAQERDQKKSAWSSDKVARADALRRRREEMVLAARRAMESKDAA